MGEIRGIPIPDGSIYFWMYSMGLRHIPYDEVANGLVAEGIEIRQKDEQNFWNGWYNSDLYHGDGRDDLTLLKPRRSGKFVGTQFLTTKWKDYPVHPYLGLPEVENRWVPCSDRNKPLIKWSNGCMGIQEARLWPWSVYLAENLKGTQHIVIDCDGDHGKDLDMETIDFLWRWSDLTHRMDKPKPIAAYPGYEASCDFRPASFHLTFSVDKVVPTMHFPESGIDIVGNRANSLRYMKDKIWNGKPMAPMTEDLWAELQAYVRSRKK